MSYGITAERQGMDAVEVRNKPRELATIAGAIDGMGRARQSANALAEMAEGIREKLGGPQASGTGTGEKGPTGPRAVVDQLNDEVRGMADPLTRIEFALRDIDQRIG